MAGDISDRTKGLLFGVVGLIVIMSALAAVIGLGFGAVNDVNAALNDANNTTGDTTGDAIKVVFPILIAVTFVIAIAGVAIAAAEFKGNS